MAQQNFTRFGVAGFAAFLFSFFIFSAKAQDTTNHEAFKPSGQLWGYAFGDYYYKAHSDALGRGGSNQYTGVPKNRNAFQFRRIYLGYNYNISPRFSAEMLLAAEDVSDATASGKYAFYIKLADIRWKNIWNGTDLVIGQVSTPAFALLEEPVWAYRSVERTITDIRRTPSYDLGVTLQGKFDPATGRTGYDLMIGNGTSAKPATNNFKWFYGDIWAKLLDQHLLLDLYADYYRLDWIPGYHHARNMVKGYIAYTTPQVTIGVEGFINDLSDGAAGIHENGSVDTVNQVAEGISAYVRGTIIKDKLGFFARFDAYNPDTKYDNGTYVKYNGLTANYEPSNKEQFIIAGLDFTPIKNIHFMPNIWYNRYSSQLAGVSGTGKHDYDLAYRLSFYYVYGK